MGETPQYSSLNDIPGPSSYSVVAPFAADIDTSRTGSVIYTQFTSDSSQINRVSSFIRSKTGDSFYGIRMMVAQWTGVPKYHGSIVSSANFKVSTYCTMFLNVYPFSLCSIIKYCKYAWNGGEGCSLLLFSYLNNNVHFRFSALVACGGDVLIPGSYMYILQCIY